jgi:hypothetical protein
MSRPRIVKIANGCQNCHRDAHEIWWIDNHGLEELLEIHCNLCGWCIGADGELRNPGRTLEGGFRGLRKE